MTSWTPNCTLWFREWVQPVLELDSAVKLHGNGDRAGLVYRAWKTRLNT